MILVKILRRAACPGSSRWPTVTTGVLRSDRGRPVRARGGDVRTGHWSDAPMSRGVQVLLEAEKEVL